MRTEEEAPTTACTVDPEVVINGCDTDLSDGHRSAEEAVAIEVMRGMQDTYVKGDFGGLIFTSFDGEEVEI